MFEQHFYIANRFMGSVVRPHVVVHGERQPPYSYAYFCSVCGDVWAKCPVSEESGEGHLTSVYQIQGGCCPAHASESPFVVPGSLMLSWEPEYNALLLSCPDVAKWELECHLDFIEQRIANESV